jgi:hypothetical protein
MPVTPSPVFGSATATDISTPTPELSLQEREAQVIELLKTNKGCQLPCWWGITPGETSLTEVQELTGVLNARLGLFIDSQGQTFRTIAGVDLESHFVFNRVSFLEQNNLIESVQVRTFSIYDNVPSLHKFWINYSPSQIIMTYGQPDRVWLKSSCCVREEPTPTHQGYSLLLFYDNQKILAHFDGLVKYAPIYHICPTFGNDQEITEIELILLNSASKYSLEQFTGIDVLGEAKDFIRTIEAATGLTVVEFYDLFLQQGEQTCFDTPRDIWP